MAAWGKICCAIDFSEPSRFAMQEAADLARRFQAELTLLHVFEPPMPSSTEVPLEVLEKGGTIEMERKIEGWRAEAERLAGRAVHSVVLTGKPAVEVARFARDQFVELLVMASHGRTGIKRLVLGSVCEHVVRDVGCAVLVIRGLPPAGGDD